MFPSIDTIAWVCPDVMVLGMLCIFGFPLALMVWVAAGLLLDVHRPIPRRVGDRPAHLIAQAPVLLAGWTLVSYVAVWQSLLNFNPRYLSMAVPFLFVIFGALIKAVLRKRWLINLVLLEMLVFHVANRDGRYYPSLDSIFERYPIAYYLRERSQTFLEAHKSDCETCRWIAREHGDRVIFTEPPYGFYFSLPQLGVVTERLDGYCYGLRSDFLKSFRHHEIDDVRPAEGQDRILVVGRTIPKFQPPQSEQDILFRDSFDPPLVVYERPAAHRSAPQVTNSQLPLDRWTLSNESKLRGILLPPTTDSVRLQITGDDSVNDVITMEQTGVRMRFGHGYALEVAFRSDRTRIARIRIVPSPEDPSGQVEPDANQWIRQLTLGSEWIRARYEFVANAHIDSTCVRIELENTPGWIEIGSASLLRLPTDREGNESVGKEPANNHSSR